MSCETYRDQFSAFFDGELRPQEIGEFEAHLYSCADCMGAYRAFERAQRLSALLTKPSAPAEMWPRLKERLLDEMGRGHILYYEAFGDPYAPINARRDRGKKRRVPSINYIFSDDEPIL